MTLPAAPSPLARVAVRLDGIRRELDRVRRQLEATDRALSAQVRRVAGK